MTKKKKRSLFRELLFPKGGKKVKIKKIIITKINKKKLKPIGEVLRERKKRTEERIMGIK